MFRKLLILGVVGLLLGAAVILLVADGPWKKELSTFYAGLTEKEIPVVSSEVEVTTDKASYAPGEPIKLTLKNIASYTIRTQLSSFTPLLALEYIERKEADGSWSKEFVSCQYPHCRYQIESPQPLRSGSKVSFTWQPVLFRNGTLEQLPLSPGVYRLVTHHQVQVGSSSESWDWHRTLSNELTVLEKAPETPTPAPKKKVKGKSKR